ncbi:DUF3604 domain-containing protein [bacterium]|nr:DUF3604 domain-containing protein [bacterium]
MRIDARSFTYGAVFFGALILAATCSSLTARDPDASPAPPVASAALQPANVKIPEYLSPVLRARVEALKADLAAAPSTPANADERALVLYDWLNAYALTGRSIPVNMPQSVATITQPGPPGRAALNALDDYIRELTLYEEQPDARGTLTSSTTGPFAPGSMQTIALTYTVGSKPISAGGGLLLGRHFMSNQGVYQTSDPAGANYVSASVNRSGVRLEPSTENLAGMFGGFRGGVDMPFFRVTGGELRSGDIVTITIGDRSRGGPGFQMQTFGNDGLRIPLYVSFTANSPAISLPDIAFSIEGGPVARVKGFAPSIARVGQPVTISVRGEDQYKNRATGPQPAYDLFVNGELRQRIPAGDKAITLVEGLAFSEPGVKRITFRSADGRITGDTNPIWVREGDHPGVFWGETHAHSAFAEGQGSIDFFYTFGRDDARLDFLGMSEHDLWMDDWEWEQLRTAAKKYDKPGEFLTFLAYEWTTPTTYGGHHNVFFRSPEGRSRSARQRCPTLTELYACLRRDNDPKDVLVIPHAHQTGEYRVSDREMGTLVEIMSLHGTFEWFGQRYLDQGHEVGFIAASDDHLSHPGYAAPLSGDGLSNRSGLAAVVAPGKDRDLIFDAMKARRTYATTGERIILDYDVAGGSFGERVDMTDKRDVKLRAIGTAPIASIVVVKNGQPVHTEDYLTDRTGRSNRVAVSFASETDPKIRDNGRGWRPWAGTLTVKGAKIESFSAPGVTNVLSEYVRKGAAADTLDFDLGTRGNEQVIYIDLDRMSRNAVIEIDLRSANESGTPLQVATPVTYPAMKVSLPAARLKEGVFVQTTPGAVFDDRVTLRTIGPEPAMDRSIAWTDPTPAVADDTYFVRVTQTDGAMAWTSPVWVGGFSRQTQ